MDSIKYFLEYSNNEGLISRLEIWEKDFEGEEIEIHGSVILKYAERKDLLQSLVPASLDITLEADENLTLQDLYTEAENKFTTKFYFDGQLLFYGNLLPDGIFEDWVNDKWELTSLSAIDGLSILKELSFVKDDGTFYIGKITQFDTLKQCLHRIGHDLPVNISIGVFYDTFSSTDSILHNVLMNADRFYQDAQKNNIMDCEAVVKSILEPYNATVIQMNGEWWIFRGIDVSEEISFKRYDGEDVSNVVWNSSLEIGSQIDDYDIHHINSNQKKSVNPSTQAFRVNYKYGTVKSLVENSDLIMGSGLDCEGWTISNAGGHVRRQSDDTGIEVFDSIDTDTEVIRNSQIIELKTDDILDFILKVENAPTAGFSGIYNKIAIKFQTDNYILSNNGWIDRVANPNSVIETIFGANDVNVAITHNLPPVLEDSDLEIIIYLRKIRVYFPSAFLFKINTIELIPSSQSNYKGEFHTAQRSTRISSVTKNDKTVSVGDSVSDIYLGTLYKENEEPTELWHHEGITETKSLLRIMVEDTLRISPRPMLYFEGDTFGYFPYLTLIAINNILGKFQISKYSYNSGTNINRTAFKEFATEYLIDVTDYRYEFDYDYGQETRVLINP